MSVIPKIRFKGFNDAWEQRKLSEIALQTYGGGTPKTANEEFWKGNIPWIQSSDLIEERLFNVKPRKYISQEAISKSSTKLVPQNSIAIVTRVGVGKLAFMPFSYATSQDFLSLSELKIEPEFAVYALYKMMRLVSNEVQGTSIKGITKDELLAKEILIPDCEEQKKIGAYLHNLDHLITLHQRKCDETKELKKYMLQKMFPQKGEKVPELRFEGFAEDWEQRKLSDCAGFRRGSFPQPYGNKDWYDGEGAMPFVQVADVSDDMKLVDDTKQKISKLAQPMSVCAEEGSVLVTLQGSIGRVAITQYKAFVDRTVLIFDKYNADIDKTFWAYIIKEKFIEEARKAPGGTIKTITKEVLSDFDLMLPSYDEQKMLGKLLHSLDDLITLHQRKCDSLKELKKFMLQNMFPKEG